MSCLFSVWRHSGNVSPDQQFVSHLSVMFTAGESCSYFKEEVLRVPW